MIFQIQTSIYSVPNFLSFLFSGPKWTIDMYHHQNEQMKLSLKMIFNARIIKLLSKNEKAHNDGQAYTQ